MRKIKINIKVISKTYDNTYLELLKNLPDSITSAPSYEMEAVYLDDSITVHEWVGNPYFKSEIIFKNGKQSLLTPLTNSELNKYKTLLNNLKE